MLVAVAPMLVARGDVAPMLGPIVVRWAVVETCGVIATVGTAVPVRPELDNPTVPEIPDVAPEVTPMLGPIVVRWAVVETCVTVPGILDDTVATVGPTVPVWPGLDSPTVPADPDTATDDPATTVVIVGGSGGGAVVGSVSLVQ